MRGSRRVHQTGRVERRWLYHLDQARFNVVELVAKVFLLFGSLGDALAGDQARDDAEVTLLERDSISAPPCNVEREISRFGIRVWQQYKARANLIYIWRRFSVPWNDADKAFNTFSGSVAESNGSIGVGRVFVLALEAEAACLKLKLPFRLQGSARIGSCDA